MNSVRGRNWPLFAPIVFVLAVVSASFIPHPAAAAGERIALFTKPIVWNPEKRSDLTAGKLEWAGGIEITSDNPHFGGLTDLDVSADGTSMLAVSSAGRWFEAKLLYDEKGRISGIAEGLLAPMLDQHGRPLKGRDLTSAQALTVDGGDPLQGFAYVAFERMHRIWRYDLSKHGLDAPAKEMLTVHEFGRLNFNGGIKSLALLPSHDGNMSRLLAITENTRDARKHIKAFIASGHKISYLAVDLHEPFQPTGVARLPDGDFVLLLRRYSPLAGVGMQLRLIRQQDVKPGALLNGDVLLETTSSHVIDNMEGLAVREDDRSICIYVISNDNFNSMQRTVLLMFRLRN